MIESDLKQRIKEAFVGVLYPGGPIVEHDCAECHELEKVFTGMDWKAIDQSVIRDNYDKLLLLSPSAFRYFLPAYLLYAIDHLAEDDVCEFTVYALIPSNKSMKERPDYQEERFAPLSSEQIGIVDEFLNMIKEDPRYINLAADIEKGQKNLERMSTILK